MEYNNRYGLSLLQNGQRPRLGVRANIQQLDNNLTGNNFNDELSQINMKELEQNDVLGATTQDGGGGLWDSVVQSFQNLSPESKWALGAGVLQGIANMYAQNKQLEAMKDAQNRQNRYYEHKASMPFEFGRNLGRQYVQGG